MVSCPETTLHNKAAIPSLEQLQSLRAVQVLEHLAAPEAKASLERLAKRAK